MPPQDPTRRLINEYRTIALDLATRMADILLAMKAKPALFERARVIAVLDFAKEAQRQRGGSSSSQSTNSSPQQVSDELAASIARIDTLSNKLRRTRFSRDALVLAGISIRAACEE
jgi:Trp operon repressor